MLKLFSSLPEEIPPEVVKLASELHRQSTENLSIGVPLLLNFLPDHIDGLFRVEGDVLVFNSLEARSHCTAINSFQIFAVLEQPVRAETIFEEAHRLWTHEIGHSDFASGRFLGLISQHLNVLQAGIKIVKDSDARKVFGVLRTIGNALLFLSDVNLTDLINLAEAQQLKTLGEGAGLFFYQVSNYLSNHPHRARELYELVHENISPSNSSLYEAALTGLANAGQVREAMELSAADAYSCDNSRIAAAIGVMGRLSHLWEKESDLKTRIQNLLKEKASHEDASVSRQAYQALANAAASQPELIVDLLSHVKPDDEAALKILGNFVFLNLKNLKNNTNFSEILHALTGLSIKSTHDLDSVLSRLIETGVHDQLVYDCLTEWILKQYANRSSDDRLSSAFHQSLMKLANKPLLHELITRWLVSDEMILGRAYSDLIGYLWVHDVREPVFSKHILDILNETDFKYLARRLLGWTFYEEALLSLIFSLLETNEAKQRTFDLVYSLLVNNLGKDYSHATQEAIQKRLKGGASPDVKNLLKEADAQIRVYTDSINQLPIRHEMRSPIPERIRHAIALKKFKDQREMSEKANEHSILQQFCTRVPLKGGAGSFSIDEGCISEINRLGSFSTFITLPAQFVVDPLNDEITKLWLRMAKRGSK